MTSQYNRYSKYCRPSSGRKKEIRPTEAMKKLVPGTSRTDRGRKNRKWQRDVLPHVNQRLMAFRQEGVLPTVRGMFYMLVSLLVINNTKSDYVQLVSKLTDWRENNTIPLHSFVDNSRRIIDIDDVFLSVNI